MSDVDKKIRTKVAERVDIELNKLIDRELQDMYGSDDEAAEYRVKRLREMAPHRAETIDTVTAKLSRRVLN